MRESMWSFCASLRPHDFSDFLFGAARPPGDLRHRMCPRQHVVEDECLVRINYPRVRPFLFWHAESFLCRDLKVVFPPILVESSRAIFSDQLLYEAVSYTHLTLPTPPYV